MERISRTVLVVLALALIGCEGKGGNARGGPTSAGARGGTAPALVGKTLAGDEFDLTTLRGKVVLVNVWATWCAPCRDELPELRRLHDANAERGFSVIGISVDRRQALRAVKQMVADFEIPYPVVFDPESEAVGSWEIRGYPTSFLIDREGTIRWRRDGIVKPDDVELTTHLNAALAAPL